MPPGKDDKANQERRDDQQSKGITIDSVAGDLDVSAKGDIVGGDKIVYDNSSKSFMKLVVSVLVGLAILAVAVFLIRGKMHNKQVIAMEAKPAIEQAKNFYQANDFQSAIKKYEVALRCFQDMGETDQVREINLKIARCYRRLAGQEDKEKNANQAKGYIDAAKSLDPEDIDNSTWADIYQGYGKVFALRSEVRNVEQNANKAIENYKKALEYLKEEEGKEKKRALIKNFLGEAYQQLSYVEDSSQNIEIALMEHENALETFSRTGTDVLIARTKNFSGSAYLALAGQKDGIANIEKAIKLHREALDTLTLERNARHHVKTKDYLGNAYFRRYLITKEKEDIEKAIKNYLSALAGFNDTEEETPLLKVRILNHLAASYNEKSKLKQPKEAKKEALDEALRTFEKISVKNYMTVYPLDWREGKITHACTYILLAEIKNPIENLNKAIDIYEKQFYYFTKKAYPIIFVKNQINLGNAYQRLSKHEKPKEKLGNAIKAYLEATSDEFLSKYPRQYAETKLNLALAAHGLSRKTERKDNLKLAIKAYQEAKKVFSDLKFLNQCADVCTNIGLAYSELAKAEPTKENLQFSIKAFQDAGKIYLDLKFMNQYANACANIGLQYAELAETEPTKENLEKSVEAFEIAVNTKEFKNGEYYKKTLDDLAKSRKKLKQLAI